MVDFVYQKFLTTERSVQLDDLFDTCKSCKARQHKENMSAIPQGAFAAKKIRKNLELEAEVSGESATRYNSKYMNSVWGMYNRFSVFNLKKLMDNQHANLLASALMIVSRGGRFSMVSMAAVGVLLIAPIKQVFGVLIAPFLIYLVQLLATKTNT